MFNKRVFLFLFLLIIVIGTVSSVGASELGDGAVGDSSFDKIGIEDNNNVIGESMDESASNQLSEIDVEDDIIAASGDDVLLVSGRPISELQNLIDKASSGSKISLRFDYYCDESSNPFGVNIDKSITINGNGHTIDAQKNSRMFNITGNNVVLNDLTFKNGYANQYVKTSSISFADVGPMGSSGGCIYAYESSLTINNCNFYNNTADSNGGAIVTSGRLDINNCIFSNNFAYGADTEVSIPGSTIKVPTSSYGQGGAIYVYASSKENSNVNIANSDFEYNCARSGGAVYIDYSSNSFSIPGTKIKTVMNNVDFHYNYAVFAGGAIYGHHDFDILDSAFVGNDVGDDSRLAGGSGGAICLENSYGFIDNMYTPVSPNVTIRGNSVFEYNHAKQRGGAILLSESSGKAGTLNIYGNVIFKGNKAKTVGAISAEGADCRVVGATFVDNTANNTAGAMYGGTAINCKFNGNSKPETNNTRIKSFDVSVKESGNYCNDKVITATLINADDGSIIKNQQVYLYAGGKTNTVRTDANGQAIFKVNLPAKQYIATISYEGEYLGLSKDVTMTIKKATPKIVASKKTFKVKVKTKKYTITLKDNFGKAMKKMNVKITVNGKTYSAKTNNNGKATFKINKLNKKGNFKATVKFAGNGYYNAVNKKVTILSK